MTRLKPPTMPPELEEKFWRSLPKGARATPSHELQVNNFPIEEPEHTYPRWDLLLEWWDDRGGDEEC